MIRWHVLFPSVRYLNAFGMLGKEYLIKPGNHFFPFLTDRLYPIGYL